MLNSAFDSGGANFTSVDLSGIVELGENAFKECSFEELVFPESLRSIGRNATPIKERASVTFFVRNSTRDADYYRAHSVWGYR